MRGEDGSAVMGRSLKIGVLIVRVAGDALVAKWGEPFDRGTDLQDDFCSRIDLFI